MELTEKEISEKLTAFTKYGAQVAKKLGKAQAQSKAGDMLRAKPSKRLEKFMENATIVGYIPSCLDTTEMIANDGDVPEMYAYIRGLMNEALFQEKVEKNSFKK